MCGEGMDVWALGVQNRGVSSVIAPNAPSDHLRLRRVRHVHRRLPRRRAHLRHLPLQDPPVGDEPRRHRLHPLRRRLQDHAGRARADDGTEIVRGDNRDKSGINGDFLCIKGRYAFDFANHPDRLTKPLVRQTDGSFAAVTWEEALDHAGTEAARNSRHARGPAHRRHRLQSHHQRRKLPAAEVRAHRARHQQHRPSPHRRLRHLRPRAGRSQATAPHPCAMPSTAPAILLLGNDPTEQHPALAWTCAPTCGSTARRIYVVNTHEIKLRRQAKASCRFPTAATATLVRFPGWRGSPQLPRHRQATSRTFRDALRAEPKLLDPLRLGVPRPRHRRAGRLRPVACRMRSSPASPTMPTRAARPTWVCCPTCCPAIAPSPHRGPSPRSMPTPAADAGQGPDRDVRRRRARRAGRALRRRLQSRRALQRRPRTRSRTPSSSCRTCSSPRPRSSPTSSFPPRISTKRPAPSPTATATCSWSRRPATAPACAPTSSSSSASPTDGRRSADSSFPSAAACAPTWASPAARNPARPTVTPSGSPRNNLEPKLSPFDPFAILDEIQRLVPGYDARCA